MEDTERGNRAIDEVVNMFDETWLAKDVLIVMVGALSEMAVRNLKTYELLTDEQSAVLMVQVARKVNSALADVLVPCTDPTNLN